MPKAAVDEDREFFADVRDIGANPLIADRGSGRSGLSSLSGQAYLEVQAVAAEAV